MEIFSLIIPLESTQMSHTVLINFQVDINFLHALFILVTDLSSSLISSYVLGKPLWAPFDVDFHVGFCLAFLTTSRILALYLLEEFQKMS